MGRIINANYHPTENSFPLLKTLPLCFFKDLEKYAPPSTFLEFRFLEKNPVREAPPTCLIFFTLKMDFLRGGDRKCRCLFVFKKIKSPLRFWKSDLQKNPLPISANRDFLKDEVEVV